jgi:hypothetical protein
MVIWSIWPDIRIRLFSVSGIRPDIRQVKSGIRPDIWQVKSGIGPDIRQIKSSIRPETEYQKRPDILCIPTR